MNIVFKLIKDSHYISLVSYDTHVCIHMYDIKLEKSSRFNFVLVVLYSDDDVRLFLFFNPHSSTTYYAYKDFISYSFNCVFVSSS